MNVRNVRSGQELWVITDQLVNLMSAKKVNTMKELISRKAKPLAPYKL